MSKTPSRLPSKRTGEPSCSIVAPRCRRFWPNASIVPVGKCSRFGSVPLRTVRSGRIVWGNTRRRQRISLILPVRLVQTIETIEQFVTAGGKILEHLSGRLLLQTARKSYTHTKGKRHGRLICDPRHDRIHDCSLAIGGVDETSRTSTTSRQSTGDDRGTYG